MTLETQQNLRSTYLPAFFIFFYHAQHSFSDAYTEQAFSTIKQETEYGICS